MGYIDLVLILRKYGLLGILVFFIEMIDLLFFLGVFLVMIFLGFLFFDLVIKIVLVKVF